MIHSQLKATVPHTLPVMFGYVPMGMAFGVLFADLGYPWYFATIMGIVIFAGAAQFLAVGLLAAGAGLTDVLVTTLLLNSRHVFYGLSLLRDFRVKGWKRWYLIFGLTDETYSLLTSLKARHPDVSEAELGKRQLIITGFNHSYWILGCTLGVLLGESIEFNTQGLEFTLVALFVVLVIEQYKAVRTLSPFIIALCSGIIALNLVKPENMLLASLTMALALLLTKYRLRPWN